jgi:hypothetical protein
MRGNSMLDSFEYSRLELPFFPASFLVPPVLGQEQLDIELFHKLKQIFCKNQFGKGINPQLPG